MVESPASAAACVRLLAESAGSLAVKSSDVTAGLEAACVDDSGARSLAVKFSAGTAGSDVAAESSVPKSLIPVTSVLPDQELPKLQVFPVPMLY